MRRIALVVLCIAGALATALAYVLEPARTSYVWLAAWIAVWITGVGAQTVLCLAALSNGEWITPMRRSFEALASSVLLSSIAILPALLMRFDGIVWARAALATALVIVSVAWSRRSIAAFGLVACFVASTIAAFDWIGGLHPRWISNALGVELLAGGVVTALGIVALQRGRAIGDEHLLTLGRALFVAACAWMYLSFAPFLVVWMGDLPAGVSWYGPRVTGAWWLAATAIVLARFVVPFVVLLTDPMRRQPVVVTIVAALLVLSEPLSLAWLVLPSCSPDRVSLRWTDAGVLALACASVALASSMRSAASAPIDLVKGYRAR